MRATDLVLLLLLLFHNVEANTEKVIFLGPEKLVIPNIHPSLGDLNLEILSALHPSLRIDLPRAFRSEQDRLGLQSWYLLDNLVTNRRYEVRICWTAVQPTAFDIKVHGIRDVFDTPFLIQQLANYSETRLRSRSAVLQSFSLSKQERTGAEKVSSLFLQVFAAADYFTSNETLMKFPEPVTIDLILDPYLLNIFPLSLVPTGIYISIVFIAGWFISGWLRTWILIVSQDRKPHID